MKQEDIKEKAVLLSLANIAKTRVYKYLDRLAHENGLEEQQVRKWYQEGKTGKEIPLELLQEWRMQQGRLFEDYVIKALFPMCSFVRWSNDKHVRVGRNTVSDRSSKYPDLTFEYNGKKFAIECKWQEKEDSRVEIVYFRQHLSNYMDYMENEGIPVYIASAFGKTGASPKTLYVTPLEYIINNVRGKKISIDKLYSCRVKDLKTWLKSEQVKW